MVKLTDPLQFTIKTDSKKELLNLSNIIWSNTLSKTKIVNSVILEVAVTHIRFCLDDEVDSSYSGNRTIWHIDLTKNEMTGKIT